MKCDNCGFEEASNMLETCPRCGETFDRRPASATNILVDQDVSKVGDDATVVGVQIQYAERVTIEAGDEAKAPAPGVPPYKGLICFDVADAADFFGREQLTADLVNYLRDHPFLAVLGASGSGKSSLVRAGVVASLRSGRSLPGGVLPPLGSQEWPVYLFTPTEHPLEALVRSLSNEEAIQRSLLDDLWADPPDIKVLRHHLTKITDASLPSLLVVDQFEELFSLCKDRNERQRFVDNLLCAAGTSLEKGQSGGSESSAKVIITLRADFYGQCAEFDNLRDVLTHHQRFIGSMGPNELQRAVELPAQGGNWTFQHGLVELLLKDVSKQPGALPLLSHALLETWKRRSGHVMTLAGYQSAGRVQGAIARTAETAFKQLNKEQKALAENIFLRLVGLGKEIAPTRRRVQLTELVPQQHQLQPVRQVLQILSEARLVTLSTSGDGQTDPNTNSSVQVELAHESLIQEWTRLAEWLKENQTWLTLRNNLSDAALRWQTLDRDADVLFRGRLLEQVTASLKNYASSLSALEADFYESSKAADVAEKARRKREKRIRWSLRALVFAGACLLILVILMASPIVVEWQEVSSLDEVSVGMLRAVSIDPRNEQTLFALDEGAGMLVSYDGGHSWERAVPYRDLQIKDLKVVNGTVYVATNAGVALSRDGGQVWTMVAGDITEGVSLLAVDPTNPEIVYVSDGFILVESHNGGNSWNPIDIPAEASGIFKAIATNGSSLVVISSNDEVWLQVEGNWRLMVPEPSFPNTIEDIAMVDTNGRFLLALREMGIADGDVASNRWRDLPTQPPGSVTAISADRHGYYAVIVNDGVAPNATRIVCRRLWEWTGRNWWKARIGQKVPCLDS